MHESRVRKIALDVVPGYGASPAILHTLQSCGPERLGHLCNANSFLFRHQVMRLTVPRRRVCKIALRDARSRAQRQGDFAHAI
jgi:hypothetical protein